MKQDFFPSVSLNKDFSLIWCSAITDNVYSFNKHLLKPARYCLGTDLRVVSRQSFFMPIILAIYSTIFHSNNVPVSLVK